MHFIDLKKKSLKNYIFYFPFWVRSSIDLNELQTNKEVNTQFLHKDRCAKKKLIQVLSDLINSKETDICLLSQVKQRLILLWACILCVNETAEYSSYENQKDKTYSFCIICKKKI